MEKLKILSLFSGIGAFEKALDNLGVPYELEGYCEIDKYASKAYAIIHDTEEWMNYGDIKKLDERVLPKDIDIVTYGFPCQDISIAGDQKGFRDENGNLTRSGLFYDALRIIDGCKPKVAIAENVKNLVSKKFTKEFAAVLQGLEDAGYNNYWKVMNAKDYGIAQNRERVFIVSVRKDIDMGLYEWPETEELKTRLLDYLEDEVDEKYYLSDKMIKYISQPGTKNFRVDTKINLDVARPITTDPNKRAGTTNYIAPDLPENFDLKYIVMPEKTKKGYALAEEGDGVYIDRPHQKRGVVQKGLIQTIKTSGADVGVVVKDTRNLKEKLADDLIKSGIVKGGEVINHSYAVSRTIDRTPIETTNGIMPTLTTRPDTLGVVTNPPLRIRKLTPKECWRLMGFDDEDHDKVERAGISNAQRYKMAGNSIVVNVVERLLKNVIDLVL